MPCCQTPSRPSCSLPKSLLSHVGLLKDEGIQIQRLPSPSLLRGSWPSRPTVCCKLRLEEAPVISLLHQGHSGVAFEVASLAVSKVCLPLMEGIDFSTKQSRWRSAWAFCKSVVASEGSGLCLLRLLAPNPQLGAWAPIASLQQAPVV